ncbi:MAG: hypothetical protein LBE18_05685 [Planctomycetaceae bacterium]|nr:hypothetical protein [Planctomycetaceae bacterium]
MDRRKYTTRTIFYYFVLSFIIILGDSKAYLVKAAIRLTAGGSNRN